MRRGRASLVALVLLPTLGGLLAAQPSTVEGTVVVSARRLVDVVVYLYPDGDPFFPPSAAAPLLDQRRLRFVPTALPVLPGTTIEFRNSDPILHNVFSPPGTGRGFDLGTYPMGESRSHTFNELGTHVILCHVHPEMYAYVIVIPTPYHAVVDEAGRFRIDGLPAGRYTVKVWHRRREVISQPVVLETGSTTRLTLTVESTEAP